MIEVGQIVESIVDQMDATIDGKYDIATGRTYFCNTKWARKGKHITDAQSNVFLIEEVEPDEYIVATPLVPTIPPDPPLVLDGLCFLTPPFWITGTKLATNREWTIAGDHLENKLPLIWLLEVTQETGYGRGNAIERDMVLRLFFLDETDPAQYYTVDHRQQVVQPMQKMMVEFLDTIERLRQFATVDEYTYRTFSRFGTENENGMLENILDANLSGVSLEFTLTKYRENCKC
jgi:hypothetical protein